MRGILISVSKRDLLVTFFIATLILICEFLLYSIRWVVPMALISMGLGVIITPVFEFAYKKLKLPKPLAILIFLLLLVGFLFFVSYLIYGLVAEQWISAQRDLPGALQVLKAKAIAYGVSHPWLETWTQEFNLGDSLYTVGNRALLGFKVGASALTGFVLILVLALYIAASPSYYFEGVLSFISPKFRPNMSRVLITMSANLRRWFQAQLIAIVTVGTLVALGLWIVGLHYWLLLALLSGVLDIVPYIGSFIPAALAILIALGTAPEKVIWVLAVFILIHQFENSLLIPLVMRYRMHFPPVILLLFMLMMATWFGVIGILMTPGIFTVLRTLSIEIYMPWMNRQDLTSKHTEHANPET